MMLGAASIKKCKWGTEEGKATKLHIWYMNNLLEGALVVFNFPCQINLAVTYDFILYSKYWL